MTEKEVIVELIDILADMTDDLLRLTNLLQAVRDGEWGDEDEDL